MFEDDLEGISDDDIENILGKDEDKDSAGKQQHSDEKDKTSSKSSAAEEKQQQQQPTKVDALDIAWESLRGEADVAKPEVGTGNEAG